MTTDTRPDPLEWLRANARFPSSKADGVAATETLAYVARLQAQVAELQREISERRVVSSTQLEVIDALAGALHDLLDAHARNTLFSGAGHWDVARAALAAAGR